MSQDALCERGRLLMRLNRPKEAIEIFRKILSSDPAHARAHFMLALCFIEIEQIESALREADLAVASDPENAWGFYVRAIALWQSDLDEGALLSLNYAISVEPDEPSFYALQARILLSMFRFQEARNACQATLRLDPEYTSALTTLSDIEIYQNNRESGIRAASSAVCADPTDANSHRTLGRSLAAVNRLQEARDAFSQALRLDPLNEHARLGLVNILKAENPLGYLLRIYGQWMFRFGFMIQLYSLVFATLLFAALLVTPLVFAESTSRLLNKVILIAAPSIVVLCIVTWLLFWLAIPISNVLFFFTSEKREVLSRKEKAGVFVFLLMLFLGIGLSIGGMVADINRLLFLGLGLLMLIQPVFFAIEKQNKDMSNFSSSKFGVN